MKSIIALVAAFIVATSALLAGATSKTAQAANCTQVRSFGHRTMIYDSGGSFYSSSVGISVNTKFGTPTQTWKFYTSEGGAPALFKTITAPSGISANLSGYHVTPNTRLIVEGPGCVHEYNPPDGVVGAVVYENVFVYGPF